MAGFEYRVEVSPGKAGPGMVVTNRLQASGRPPERVTAWPAQMPD